MIVPARSQPSHLIRRAAEMAWFNRWSGILAVAAQAGRRPSRPAAARIARTATAAEAERRLGTGQLAWKCGLVLFCRPGQGAPPRFRRKAIRRPYAREEARFCTEYIEIRRTLASMCLL